MHVAATRARSSLVAERGSERGRTQEKNFLNIRTRGRLRTAPVASPRERLKTPETCRGTETRRAEIETRASEGDVDVPERARSRPCVVAPEPSASREKCERCDCSFSASDGTNRTRARACRAKRALKPCAHLRSPSLRCLENLYSARAVGWRARSADGRSRETAQKALPCRVGPKITRSRATAVSQVDRNFPLFEDTRKGKLAPTSLARVSEASHRL